LVRDGFPCVEMSGMRGGGEEGEEGVVRGREGVEEGVEREVR